MNVVLRIHSVRNKNRFVVRGRADFRSIVRIRRLRHVRHESRAFRFVSFRAKMIRVVRPWWTRGKLPETFARKRKGGVSAVFPNRLDVIVFELCSGTCSTTRHPLPPQQKLYGRITLDRCKRGRFSRQPITAVRRLKFRSCGKTFRFPGRSNKTCWNCLHVNCQNTRARA